MQHYLRPIWCIVESNSETGSKNTSPTTSSNENVTGKQTEEAKEFSKALAKRAAEIEAKYSDYEQLKEKAGKLDEIEEAKKSELDKLREQTEKAVKERDELKAARERDLLIRSIGKETGLDVEVVSLLQGDGEALKANAMKLKEIIGETNKKQQEHKPKLPPANPPTVGQKTYLSPTQLLSNAYAEK
jgi:predicted  nucleic acid-binding Zn-ribbon protein